MSTEPSKTYSDTDIPDELMNRAALAIFTGEVKQADLESPQRLVARGMLIEQMDKLSAEIDRLLPPEGVKH